MIKYIVVDLYSTGSDDVAIKMNECKHWIGGKNTIDRMLFVVCGFNEDNYL